MGFRNNDRGGRSRGGFGRDQGRRSSGGFNGGRDGGRGRSFNRERSGFGDRRPEMHDVICDKCKKECQVPFKPTGDKPVLCSDCFRKDGGDSRAGSTSGISQSQFNQLNSKLDRILEILEQVEFEDLDEEDEESEDEEESKESN